LVADDSRLSREQAWRVLVKTLYDWTEKLQIPVLGNYGLNEAQVGKVVAGSRGSSMQTNPIVLTDGEIADIVNMRL